MSDAVIQVEGLGKRYRIGAAQERNDTLRDVLARRARSFGRRMLGRGSARQDYEEFWALKDVSFEVRRGECVGIIGRNGAGKSTLLKLLSRITEPTEGRFRMRGRVASLLEVGTGFHPELTGRENVFLNGAILGMGRKEITHKFDEIAAFAEIEKFLDTPVKHFSSGMYMRLAFAVAAHLEPEILVVDEVLAVGDAQFQAKCLNKMDDVTRHGRTVLFVSHNMFAVERLTTHGVVLQQGAVVFDGPTNNAITTYLESTGRAGMSDGDVENAPRPIPDLRQQIQFTRLDFADGRSEIEADEPIRLRLFARANGSVASIRFGATIFRADGSPVGCCFTPHVEAPPEGETGTYQLEFQQHRLAPGSYHFGLSAGRGDHLTGYTDYDILLDVLRFEIKPEEGAGGTISHWMPTWGPIRLNPPCLTKIT